MRARGGAGAAPREAAAARSCASSRHAGGAAVVDRTAHERMAERERTPVTGRADELCRDQAVDRRRVRRHPAAAAASSGSNGSPATAAP